MRGQPRLVIRGARRLPIASAARATGGKRRPRGPFTRTAAAHATPQTNAAPRAPVRRKVSPRSAAGTWESPSDRRDPVGIIEEGTSTAIESLVPIRYGRMSASPFTFYRGTAAIMAADLRPTAVTGINAQLCGDAHLSNFGLYGAPNRSMVFDINDFDVQRSNVSYRSTGYQSRRQTHYTFAMSQFTTYQTNFT